jgi:hypothetical protein
MIKRLYEELVSKDADTVYCGLYRYDEAKNVVRVPTLYSEESFSDGEIIEKILLRMMGNEPEHNNAPVFFMSVWHGLYSMSIIKEYQIRFPSERIFMSEDLAFHIDYLLHSHKVYVLPDCLYYYRVTQGSLTMVYDPNRFERIKSMHLQTIEKLKSFLPKSQYQQIELGWFLNYVGGQIYSAVGRKKEKMYENVKRIVCDEIVQQSLDIYNYHKNPAGKRLFNHLMRKKRVGALIVIVKIRHFII